MAPVAVNGGTETTLTNGDAAGSLTLQYQSKLPKLPVPPLQDTARRYLRSLEGLQDAKEHEATRHAVEDFLKGEGPRLQEKLTEYAATQNSYIEEFWYESYLNHSDSVVLALNPFFVLEDDPTPSRGSQLARASSLITSSLGFIHDMRNGLLEPDKNRGTPLDMDQYGRLFGTSRVPTDGGCRMNTNPESRHIVVIRRGQFYFFDVVDEQSRPILTEREIQVNLKAILADADTTLPPAVAAGAVGILTTENRKLWAELRNKLQNNKKNQGCLEAVEEALFVVCLDDASPSTPAEIAANFLCGTYKLEKGVQTGTCTNRWYDKLQIIVCENGTAGINFEHTGVDGHTVLRFAADVYTDNLLLMAKTINSSAPTLFKAQMSPHSKFAKTKAKAIAAKSGSPPPSAGGRHKKTSSVSTVPLVTVPRKLEWQLTPEILLGIRFAETRLSDLICQNDCQVLEYTGFGKAWITKHGFSPDAFVQMAFQAGYFGLYGRVECVYEPAMTKGFLHGRTEAIRSVQPESLKFTKTFFSDAPIEEKIKVLRDACANHSKLTRDCSNGLGQDRHLYALYCMLLRESQGDSPTASDDASASSNAKPALPAIFTDHGWSLLNTSIMSTSNCGNPALRMFGFGPVAPDGFGIGYIIKDDGISICASSKHLQTRRLLDTMAQYLTEVQKMVISIYRQANERQGAFVDHSGNLIDSRTGSALVIQDEDEEAEGVYQDGEAEDANELTSGYSFFDAGEIEKVAGIQRKRGTPSVGRTLVISEY